MSEYLIKEAIVEAYGEEAEQYLIDLEHELELAEENVCYETLSYDELWGDLTPEQLKLIEEF